MWAQESISTCNTHLNNTYETECPYTEDMWAQESISTRNTHLNNTYETECPYTEDIYVREMWLEWIWQLHTCLIGTVHFGLKGTLSSKITFTGWK